MLELHTNWCKRPLLKAVFSQTISKKEIQGGQSPHKLFPVPTLQGIGRVGTRRVPSAHPAYTLQANIQSKTPAHISCLAMKFKY